MNTRHRAYALTEMLVILAAVVVLMALSARPLRTLISEIPRSARITQSLNTTTRVLNQLKQDIEQSRQITALDNRMLTLEQQGGTVTYTLRYGQVTRRPGLLPQDEQCVWQLPNVCIEPNLWSDNGQPYAVELTTWNQQTVLGREQRRFKQTTVFFKKGTRQ